MSSFSFFMPVEAQNITHTPHGEAQVRLIRPQEISTPHWPVSFICALSFVFGFIFDIFNVSIR